MKKNICIQHYNSPCGEMTLASVDGELCLCDWLDSHHAEHNKRRMGRWLNADFREEQTAVTRRAAAQLDEYFAGLRTTFDLPLRLVGTDFQRSAWRALLQIPFGTTQTYKDVAIRIGNGRGVRAVAQAIGANGMSIIVPCHRVVGSDHSLTGFAGGLATKRALLELEGAMVDGHVVVGDV